MKSFKQFVENIQNDRAAMKHRTQVNCKIAAHNASISNRMNNTRELVQGHVSHSYVHKLLNKGK